MSGFIGPIGPRNNLTASAPPATTDNAAAGYSRGSMWFDGSTGTIYYYIDEAAGSANWTMDPSFGPDGLASGNFQFPDNLAAPTTAPGATVAHAVAWPFTARRRLTYDRIGMQLTTPQAGAEARLAIYRDDFGTPKAAAGGLILDAGTISLASGSGDILATINQSMLGPFWVVIFMKDVATQATITVRSVLTHRTASVQGLAALSTTIKSYYVPLTYPGSAPDAAPSFTSASTLLPVPQLRVA